MGQARGRIRQLAAAAIGLGPVVAVLIWMRLRQGEPFDARDLFVYPLVFGGGTIVLITALLRFMCGERLAALNLRPAAWWVDLLWGLGLLAVFVVLAVVGQFTISRWFPRDPAPELRDLVAEISDNPLLLALWLGPVVWIGVALFEELSRVFLLSRLWLVWPGTAARRAAVVASSLLFGLAHAYQGPAGVISTGVMGLIAGWFYLIRGRVWPLIISHALYDSAWIIFGVVMTRRVM